MTYIPHATTITAFVVWLLMAYVGAYGAWRGYDTVAHGLAGYAIGGIAAGVALVYGPGWFDPLVGALLAAAIASTVASVAWEWYEYELSINPWHGGYSLGRAWEDTGSDIATVALGAAIAAIVWVVA